VSSRSGLDAVEERKPVLGIEPRTSSPLLVATLTELSGLRYIRINIVNSANSVLVRVLVFHRSDPCMADIYIGTLVKTYF
jgi:hypothetical protein